MKARTFTVEEANKLIPKIKNTFDDIFVSRKKIAFMKNEMDWIHDFWGKELRDSDNPDGDRYDGLEDAIENEQDKIQKKIDGLQKNGCIVKDVAGLVDFYSIINNELVFLCWQYGEKSIQYWHPIGAGKGRRPFSKIDKIE